METNDCSPFSIYQEIFPGDTNSYGTAFGGKILALMDCAAGLAATRFAHGDFVTASLDALEFRAPVRLGEIAEIEARVVYTSKHTCGVKVLVFAVDKATWSRRRCCEGVIFMVAVGEKGRVRAIPQLLPDSEQAKKDWALAESIHREMLQRHSGPANS